MGPKFLTLAPNADIDAVVMREPTPTTPGKLRITDDSRKRFYAFRRLPAERGVLAAVELLSDAVEQYRVEAHEDGRYDCACGDFQYRSGPQGRPCRHIMACLLLGLLGGAGGIDNTKPTANKPVAATAAELDDF